jgi:opacity protein-like surface antigen
MKHIAQSLTLALAALAITTTAPRAGEWVGSGGVIQNYGGTKDYRSAAVPVPAPRPAPIEKAEWYLRGDIGYLIANHQEYSIDGTSSGREISDSSDTAFGGIGFGRYISPGWRVDFTADFKPKRRVAENVQQFTQIVTASAATDSHYAVSYTDSGSITNYSGMVNVYRDLERHGAITPYFGFGVGFAMQQLQYSLTQSAQCIGDFDVVTGLQTSGTCSGQGPGSGSNGSKGTMTWGFAAAAMAGFTIDVMPGVKMDSSYRLMWENVAGSVKSVVNDGTKFSVTDGLEHSLRTGIRIDLN